MPSIAGLQRQQRTQREEKHQHNQPSRCRSRRRAQKTVILDHTDNDAYQLRPANVRREHRKPARSMPLSLTMTSGHTSEEVSFSSLFSSSSSPDGRKKKPSPADETQRRTTRFCFPLRQSGSKQARRTGHQSPGPAPAASAASSAPPASSPGPASAPPLPSAPQSHGTSGRRARPHRRHHLQTPPERAGRESACRPLGSAADCGHSSATPAPRGCPAAPQEVVCSVPVGASCVTFTTSSTSALAVFGHRGAACCSTSSLFFRSVTFTEWWESSLPGPSRSTDAHAATCSAVVAAAASWRLQHVRHGHPWHPLSFHCAGCAKATLFE